MFQKLLFKVKKLKLTALWNVRIKKGLMRIFTCRINCQKITFSTELYKTNSIIKIANKVITKYGICARET